MPYAEMSYFDGYQFAHIAAFVEHKRLARIDDRARRAQRERKSRAACERRFGSRAVNA